MSYIFTENSLGLQPIATTSTVKNHAIGTIRQAADPTYGSGEFIYLLGVASTAVGDAVTYNSTTGQTTRSAVGANKSLSVAFAMSANVAAQYGWYQISGIVRATKAATISLAAGVAVGVKTVGRISVSGTGKELSGAVVAAVASAKTGVILVSLVVNRPVFQGRIT
jgi:hypothetical protein